MEEKHIILEVEELTKSKVRKIVRDEIKKEFNSLKTLDEKDVKKIIKDMMIKQYKFFWEKKSFWVNNL